MNLISKLNAKRTALANRKRKGFTMVEMVIVIVIIAVLMAALIPTFATVVQNAQTSAATQAMKSSYEAIKAYDLHDNGYLDSAANGVIVYKASDTTKGYFAVVTNGEMGDVYIMEKLDASATAWDLEADNNTSDVMAVTLASGTETSTISNTAGEDIVSFTWKDEGFTDIKGVGKVTNDAGTIVPSDADPDDADSPDDVVDHVTDNDAVMNMALEDVTDNVCFYSIGEGSVEAAVGKAIPG